MKKKQRGFTLIELMISVAIVGILASIAIPNYQGSIRKSRREDAKAALVSFANAMERHYTEISSYCASPDAKDTATCDDSGGLPTTIFPSSTPIDSPSKKDKDTYYDLSIDASTTTNTYLLRATPHQNSSQVSDECGTLTLDHTGRRNLDPILQPNDSRSNCW